MLPAESGSNGRDAAGRFVKGNPGGPGRPRRRDLHSVAAERASSSGLDLEAELWEVCKALLTAAKGGDVQAARVVLSHLTGDPTTCSMPDTIVIETGVPRSEYEATGTADS